MNWPSVRLWPPSRGVVIRILAALLLIAIASVTNRQFLGWGLFVVFAVLAVPLGRARSFVFSFVPYAAVWFIFTALRSLADETALAQRINTEVAQFERWLFGGQLPTVSLQDRFLDIGSLAWYDYFFTAIHWSYFLVPHAVAIRAWQKRPALFRHFLSAMTFLLIFGLLLYFLIPSNPPWLAPEQINSPAAPTVFRVMESVGKQLGGGLYQASYRVIGESNPIAAMPSIHMAITVLLIFPARAAGKRWALAAYIYSALMGMALVYLGEHYVVDVIVGTMIAIYGWVAASAWIERVVPVLLQRISLGSLPVPLPRPRA